jgi:thymidylate kinase
MFVMVDGIDGSGKRTIVEAMRDELLSKGKICFDLGEWSKVHHALPELSDIQHANAIIGVEPSYAWAGAAIRDEMVRNGRGYTSRQIAEAFSTDRLTLYRRCYLPALEHGSTILTERGVSSSIAYQPAADPALSLEDVLAMSGNAFALKYAPTHLVVASLDPRMAIERLNKRSTKADDAVFEKEPFLQTLHERYHSDWFKKLFTDRGTHVHFLDTSTSIEEVRTAARALLMQLV